MFNVEIDPELASFINKNNWEMVEEHERIFRKNHQRCSVKKLFLNILQYSQENTYVGVPF